MTQIYGFIVNLKNDSVSNDAINVIDLKIKWSSNKYLVLYFVRLHFKYFKLDNPYQIKYLIVRNPLKRGSGKRINKKANLT